MGGVVEGEAGGPFQLSAPVFQAALPQLGVPRQHVVLGGSEDAIEPPQDGKGEDDVLVLSPFKAVADQVRDVPDEADDFGVGHGGVGGGCWGCAGWGFRQDAASGPNADGVQANSIVLQGSRGGKVTTAFDGGLIPFERCCSPSSAVGKAGRAKGRIQRSRQINSLSTTYALPLRVIL